MYVQYIILLSSYHCVFILFKSEIISYAKKWHIILLTYSTANNKHWRKKNLFLLQIHNSKLKNCTSFHQSVMWRCVAGRERLQNADTELKQLHCWSWRTTTRKANTTKTRDYHDKTGNRQRARDREGERNLTDTRRYDWGNGQLNIETRQAQITNTGDAGEDTQWQTQKGNRLNKQVTKN